MIERLIIPVTSRDNLRGTPRATIVLVQYGDYASPECRRLHDEIEDLTRWLGERDFCFVYRHFPRPDDSRSLKAAEAAEAAAAQNLFWEMHKSLYERNESLDFAALVERAARIGLDLERFQTELRAGIYRPRVAENYQSGIAGAVDSAPAFFINSRKYDGEIEIDALLDRITQAGDESLERRGLMGLK